MTVKYVNEGSGPFGTIASIASLALAPFTAGTSMAWLPGVIGAANGIANGNPTQAVLGGLGAAGGAGVFNNLGAASGAGNTIEAADLINGTAVSKLANADTAKSAFNFADLSKKFGTMGALSGMGDNGNKTSMTGGGQQAYTSAGNSMNTMPFQWQEYKYNKNLS